MTGRHYIHAQPPRCIVTIFSNETNRLGFVTFLVTPIALSKVELTKWIIQHITQH